MPKHSLLPNHDNDRRVKKKKRTHTANTAGVRSPLEQLPYELLTSIFVLSENAALPLVSRALHYALYRCTEDVKLAWLLQRCAGNMHEALALALRFRFLNERLLDRFDAAHGDTVRLDDKKLPTHLFAAEDETGPHALVERLLARGASPHKPQGYPLIKSAQMGHRAMVKTLVSYGADATAKDNMALRVCAARDNRELVTYFLSDLGIKPDSETLKACVRKDLWDMVKLLVDHGAVPDLSTINCT